MLRHIPRQPRKCDVLTLQQKLTEAGYQVDIRTIQRDLVKLSTIMPITSDGARPQGWSWKSDAPSLDILAIDPQTALVFKMVEQHLSPLLPKSTLEYLAPWLNVAEHILELDHIKLSGWKNKVAFLPRGFSLSSPQLSPTVESTLYEAILSNKQVHIHYQNRHQLALKEYTIHPLALVAREQLIYIICTINDHSDVRHLVLHRIKEAELLASEAKRPALFNLQDYIQSGELGFAYSNQAIEVELKVSAHAATSFYEADKNEVLEIIALEDSAIKVRVKLPDTKEMRTWLLGFGCEVEVMAPTELRDEFFDMIKQLNKLY